VKMLNNLGNGYVKITNESMEALAKIRIPGQARQVLDFILRKTYGWNKKTDMISLSQFVAGTGLSKVAVCKAINKLLKMNLITKKGNALSLFTKKGNEVAITYGFQKNYNLWLPLPKKVTLPKKVKYVTKKGNRTLPKKDTTKDTITKETITKEKVILPDWVPLDLWKDFKQLRLKLKKPLTVRAEKLNLKELEKLKTLGNDPTEVIEQTIMKGWQGFFPLRNKEKQPKTGSWQTDANLRAAKAFLERNDDE